MIKAYYHLTKPGIIYGNSLSLIAGFLLASKGQFNVGLFLAALAGLSLIIGSGCVFNNVYDRHIDAKMQRTKNRAMVTGKISKTNAIIFGIILLLLGIVALHHHVNNSALIAAITGWIVYVLIYTPFKHRNVHATLIGSIAGATPPVVGYTAVTNGFDAGALILFLILVFWQMPHFYSIAMHRLNDYTSANIPVLPIKKGIRATKIQMLIYILLFMVAAASLTYFKFTGYVYLLVIILISLKWLWYAIKGFNAADDKIWAKKMFSTSLMVLTSLCVIISISSLIHK